jgi:D-beta-D-heptose 7-phosphate kinase/D-beta-D-heptose 1-phosphate adenosyltransferase
MGIVLSPERVKELLTSFKNKNVVVVGDAMLDRYLWGKVTRISPEAPVPVVDVEGETMRLGGAANVAKNISAMGGKPFLAAVVGSDEAGEFVKRGLDDLELVQDGIVMDEGRKTTVKTRIIASQQQVVRADQESRHRITDPVRSKLLESIMVTAGTPDAIIVSDYGKGVVDRHLLQELHTIKDRYDIPLCVDPKEANFFLYENMTLITPNQKEASFAAGQPIHSDQDLRDVGWRLVQALSCLALLITRGEHGMTLFETGGDTLDIPTVARKVYDVTGAGDTVVSTAALTLASGGDFREAAVMANHSAGVVIRELGAVSATADQVLASFEENGYGSGSPGN